MLPGVHCYTLEVSCFCAAQGNLRAEPYTPQSYVEMGHQIGMALHECVAPLATPRATPVVPLARPYAPLVGTSARRGSTCSSLLLPPPPPRRLLARRREQACAPRAMRLALALRQLQRRTGRERSRECALPTAFLGLVAAD